MTLGAEIPHLLHCESNIRGINLLPAAVPHPTGPQHGQSERNREEKDGKQEVRYSQELEKVKLLRRK